MFSRLSHAELERLALVCGERAQAISWAATEPGPGRSSCAAAVPRRHGGVAGGVVFSVTSSPSTPRTPAHRSSLSLRIVLEALDRSGAGSLEFWRVYWTAVPHLTEADLVRVARAVGPVGRAHLRTLSGREARATG